MRSKYLIMTLILVVFLMSGASAGIVLSQPKALYNLGDEINMEIEVSSFSSGYFTIDLICNGQDKNVYNSILNTKKTQLNLPLTRLYIGNLTGRCYFLAEYGFDSQTTENFEISNNIEITFDIKEMDYEAGGSVLASGTAIKKNGKLVGQDFDGFVEITAGTTEKGGGEEEEGEEQEEEESEEEEEESEGNVSISAETESVIDEEVSFTGEADELANEYDLTYYWEFGDGEDDEGKEVTHIYDEIGGYEVTFVITYTNDEGEEISEEATHKITIKEEGSEEEEEETEEEGSEEEIEGGGGDEEVESNLKYTGIVKDGKFSVNFSLQENMGPGSYPITAYIYEKDEQGNILNYGEGYANINIKQKVKKISIVPNSQSFKPGDDLRFQVVLYDQLNEKVDGNAMVMVKNSLDEEVWKQIVETGETINLTLKENSVAGYWKISAEKDEINGEVLFEVKQTMLAKFELEGNILIITNVGNVPYKKSIQIGIGGEIQVKDIELDVGESKKFSLLAPEGGYKISVTDGVTSISEEGVSLTGNVIGIKELERISLWTKYPIVWLFLIVVMGLFVLMMYQKVASKKSFSYPVSGKEIKKERKKEFVKGQGIEAEHVLVLHGQKQNAVIVAVKIKNDIKGGVEKNLESAFEKVSKIKGAVYKSGDYIFIIFSPLITKTSNNEINAVRAGSSIKGALNEYNRKSKDKIEFGIGINLGEIINKVENGKLKFSGLGKTLSSVKKIAEISGGEVLLGKEFHEKTRNKIKVEKAFKESKDTEVFRIKKVITANINKKFIDDFLKKLNDEKK